MEINMLEIAKEDKTLHDLCNKELNNIWKRKDASKEFRDLFKFHLFKFRKLIHARSEWDEFANDFYYYISDLVYQGYFLGAQLSVNPEVEIQDIFLEQPNGLIREQSYDILLGATGDINRTVTHLDNMSFLEQMKNVDREIPLLLEQMKVVAASYGCYRFFLELRNKRQLAIREVENIDTDGIIYRSDDLFFITPYKFLVCLNTNPNAELWEMNYWSGINTREQSVGKVLVSYFTKNTLNQNYQSLPYYQGIESLQTAEPKVFIDIIAKDEISDYEKTMIMSEITQSLVDYRNVKRENIYLSITNSADMEYYQL